MMLPLRRAWARPNCAPRRTPFLSAVRPAVELLEDRLAPSVTTDPHQLWRQQRYTVSDAAAIRTVAPPAVRSQDAGSQPVNSSFGSLIGLDKSFAAYAYRGT